MTLCALNRIAFTGGMILVFLALSGCSNTVDYMSYPNVSNIQGVTSTLTPQERDEAIRALEAEQKNHRTAAIKEIEKK